MSIYQPAGSLPDALAWTLPRLSNVGPNPLNLSSPSDKLLSNLVHPGYSQSYFQFCHVQLTLLSFCQYNSMLVLFLPTYLYGMRLP